MTLKIASIHALLLFMPIVHLFYSVKFFHLKLKSGLNIGSIILKLNFKAKAKFYFIILVLQFIKENQKTFFQFFMEFKYQGFYYLLF